MDPQALSRGHDLPSCHRLPHPHQKAAGEVLLHSCGDRGCELQRWLFHFNSSGVIFKIGSYFVVLSLFLLFFFFFGGGVLNVLIISLTLYVYKLTLLNPKIVRVERVKSLVPMLSTP